MICGKIIHATRFKAVEAIRGTYNEKRAWKRNDQKAVYFCNDCNGWHTTSSKETVNIKKRKFAELKGRDSKAESAKPKQIEHLIIHNPRKFKIK